TFLRLLGGSRKLYGRPCHRLPRVGTSSGTAALAPPSGGHMRPGFAGRGSPDEGEESGTPRPCERPELVAPFSLKTQMGRLLVAHRWCDERLRRGPRRSP